ncbi:PilZ domain-containing protein [Sphingomonas sp. HH69]
MTQHNHSQNPSLDKNKQNNGHAQESFEYESRRKSARNISVLQIGKLVTERDQMLCLVKNISAGGAKVYALRSLAVDKRLRIEFRSGITVDGSTIWADGLTAGIRFDHEIDISQLVGSGAESIRAGQFPRHPRLDIIAAATMKWDESSAAGEVINISQTGVCIEAHPLPLVHQRVTLKVENLPTLQARVVWRNDRRAGLAFNQSLPYEMLGHWVMEQRPRRFL